MCEYNGARIAWGGEVWTGKLQFVSTLATTSCRKFSSPLVLATQLGAYRAYRYTILWQAGLQNQYYDKDLYVKNPRLDLQTRGGPSAAHPTLQVIST